MAVIRIYDNERKGDDFPSRCVKCGAETDLRVTKSFAWAPGWVLAFLLLGLIPYLIALLILRKTMTVTLPVCGDHRGHWRNRSLFAMLGLLFWVVYAIGLAIAWADLDRDVSFVAGMFLLFGGLGWLLVAAIYCTSGIQPKRITDDFIELAKVNKDVAEEWAEITGDLPRPRHRRKREAQVDDAE